MPFYAEKLPLNQKYLLKYNLLLYLKCLTRV